MERKTFSAFAETFTGRQPITESADKPLTRAALAEALKPVVEAANHAVGEALAKPRTAPSLRLARRS